jgi:hypothetical protein
MTLDTVGEFDTRGTSSEYRTVRVVFDSVRRNYRVGYGCTDTPDTAFECWTAVDWGQPLTAKHAHRLVRSYDTHLRCLEAKIACAQLVEVHAKERGLW